MQSGFVQITNNQLNTTSTFRNGLPLGKIGVARDGSMWRWSLAGAVNLAAGKITITPAAVVNHANLALASTSNIAVGSTQIAVTLGGTAATQDLYLDGFITINDGTGIGQTIQIAGNSAQASTSGVVLVNLTQGLTTALAIADTKVTLSPNLWGSTIISASAVAAFCNGVPQVAVPAASYYWSKTQGLASVLQDGPITKGAGGIISDAVNGAVEIEVAATVTGRVGLAPELTVTTKYNPFYMTLE